VPSTSLKDRVIGLQGTDVEDVIHVATCGL